MIVWKAVQRYKLFLLAIYISFEWFSCCPSHQHILGVCSWKIAISMKFIIFSGIIFLFGWFFFSFLCYATGSYLVALIIFKTHLLEQFEYERTLIENKPEFIRKSKISYEYRSKLYYQWEFIVLIGFLFWLVVGWLSYFIYVSNFSG